MPNRESRRHTVSHVATWMWASAKRVRTTKDRTQSWCRSMQWRRSLTAIRVNQFRRQISFFQVKLRLGRPRISVSRTECTKAIRASREWLAIWSIARAMYMKVWIACKGFSHRLSHQQLIWKGLLSQMLSAKQLGEEKRVTRSEQGRPETAPNKV